MCVFKKRGARVERRKRCRTDKRIETDAGFRGRHRRSTAKSNRHPFRLTEIRILSFAVAGFRPRGSTFLCGDVEQLTNKNVKYALCGMPHNALDSRA